jgi:copper chaperone CopZ
MRFLGAVLVALVLVACGDTNAAQQSSATAKAVFHIDGMTCGGCEAGVKVALEKLAGVQNAEVSYEESRASVTYDPGKVSTQDMKAAVEGLGYQARLAESKVKS